MREVLSSEGGFTGGAESLVLGGLVFMFGMILSINAWGIMDAQFAADGAAREATRMIVEAPQPHLVTSAQVAQVAGDAIAISGHDRNLLTLESWSIQRHGGGGLDEVRCATVEVRVRQSVRTLRMPFIDTAVFGNAWTVSASHVEVVDPFRSDLAGEAACAF